MANLLGALFVGCVIAHALYLFVWFVVEFGISAVVIAWIVTVLLIVWNVS